MKRKVIAEVLILLAMLAVILCSCGAKKKVSESILTHDTLVIVRTDTIISERVIRHTDTLRIETERVVTLRDRGGEIDTIRIVTNNDHYRYIYVQDSSQRVKAKADSVIKSLDKIHNKEVTKRTAYPWKWLIVGAVLFLLCIYILRSNTK